MASDINTTVVTAGDSAYAWGALMLVASMRRNGMPHPVVVWAMDWREEQKRRVLIPPHVRQQIADYFIRTRQIPYLYIMQLCYRCLIRPKEILMLKIKDIDFVDNIINLPADVAKNHKARTIGVPAEIMAYLNKIRGHDL